MVFAFLAPEIAARFFPESDPLSGLIQTFGVFAVGYLMRPLGGALFGQWGDRRGRTRALRFSMVAMAIPTALVATLPTHDQIGLAAPLLLVALRLAQGLSIGGELAGSICYLVEIAPPGRRALYGSLTILGVAAGLLLASAAVTGTRAALGPEALAGWGWRLPFAGGLAIGAIGWWTRRTLGETPVFLRAEAAGETVRGPFRAVLRDHARLVLSITGMSMLVAAGFYTLFAWMPTYLTRMVRPPIPGGGAINTGEIALLTAVIPLAGWVADRVGPRPLLIASALAYAALAVPMFRWIDTGAPGAAIAGLGAMAVVHGFSNGPIAAALTDAAPPGVRYSAIAIGYNLAFAVFGGTAPLVATWLVQRTGALTAPAWYLAALALASAAVIAATRPAAADR